MVAEFVRAGPPGQVRRDGAVVSDDGEMAMSIGAGVSSAPRCWPVFEVGWGVVQNFLGVGCSGWQLRSGSFTHDARRGLLTQRRTRRNFWIAPGRRENGASD